MRSAIRKRSYGSVTIYSVDGAAVLEALQRLETALRQRQEVLAVVLFGSFQTGRFGVGSDVDLLLVLEDSPVPFLERIPMYLPDDFPVDIDVFPYTRAEIRAGHPLAKEALLTGQLRWIRAGLAISEFLEDTGNSRDAPL